MKRRWRYLFGAFLLAAGLLAGCADGVVPTQQPAQETERGAAGQQEQEECFFHFCLVCLFSFVRFPAKLQKICAFPVNLLQSWHVNLKRI